MARAPVDDYYELLGLEPDADAAHVRRVWRKLALRWHPDRAGAEATFIFQRLSAAYEVLSDPLRRAAYDRSRGKTAAKPPAPRPPSPPSPPPAPVDDRKRAPGVLLHRLSGNLKTIIMCGDARRAEDGVIELFVNTEEAATGGMATIAMPVKVRCPMCDGAAEGCGRCKRTGAVEERYSAWLAIPPDVTDGLMLDPSAQLPGMLQPVRFRVRIDPAL